MNEPHGWQSEPAPPQRKKIPYRGVGYQGDMKDDRNRGTETKFVI